PTTFTDGKQVVGEGVGGAAALGPADHGDVKFFQLQANVTLGDERVVPGGDLAEEDAQVSFSRKAQLLGRIRDVETDDDAAGGHGQQLHVAAQFLLDACDFLVVHGCVAGAEQDHPFGELPDAGATADGLVINADIGVFVVILKKPAFV